MSTTIQTKYGTAHLNEDGYALLDSIITNDIMNQILNYTIKNDINDISKIKKVKKRLIIIIIIAIFFIIIAISFYIISKYKLYKN